MLTLAEKIIFIAMTTVVVGGLTTVGFYGIFKIIRSGRSAPPRKNLIFRSIVAVINVGLQRTIFRARPVLSIFHSFVFFGFSFYFIVNFTDLLEGFINGFELFYGGKEAAEVIPALSPLVDLGIVNYYNLTADILSILTLIGMAAFLVRRFRGKDQRLKFNKDVLLHPKVVKGSVHRDSAIVGVFILLHVGSRFLGQALRLAKVGEPDPFMPFASLVANVFSGLTANAFEFGIHFTWWTAIGLIVLFFPYFVYSKHIHLMIAPINLALAKQTPPGQLDPAAPEGANGDVEPGAKTLQDLSWPRLLDAYACIMCNRCNDVCPIHFAGWSLSPAAVEVNKRYLINEEFKSLSRGGVSERALTEHVISTDAVWTCTTCYACVQICPVGNEPMADIIDIRRSMILEGDEFDSGIQSAMESIGSNGNWFNKGRRARAKWAKALEFKIKDVTKEPTEYLWFVGDTASFDERVIPKTQAVARVLQYAGLDYGILYKEEHNSGNDVRRAGEEGLFEQSVEKNLEAFGKSQFNQILTTDPHSLNSLRNEYPQYGGKWPVHHYTNILLELIDSGQLELKRQLPHYKVTYHDPCYLGRYNDIYAVPRKLLKLMGVEVVEMPRNKENSFCCGAGGMQISLSDTPEGERPAENRIKEAITSLSPGANGSTLSEKKLLFIVSCPKDVVMYTDAVKSTGNENRIEVRDIIDLIVESIEMPELAEKQIVEQETV